MKTNLIILTALVLFFSLGGHAQVANDSVRTRNDKPGTPQSLRTPDMAPQSHVTILNTKNAPNQNVVTTGSGSNSVNNSNGQTTVTVPNTSNTSVPKSGITLKNRPLNRLDTIPKATAPITNKAPNVSNPIRNN